MKPENEGNRNPVNSPLDNFWNYIKNKTESAGNRTKETVVTSPVLHLGKNPEENEEQESTRIQTYPAVAVVINTFGKDGNLKKSVTHFQPDFNSLKPVANKEAIHVGDAISADNSFKNNYNTRHTVGNSLEGNPFLGGYHQLRQQGGQIPWPFAGYFPIVINDPFLAVYNALATSMYNAVTSMVEYGPEADICRKGGNHQNDKDTNSPKSDVEVEPEVKENPFESRTILDRYQKKDDNVDVDDPNLFDEVTMRSESFRRTSKRPLRLVTGKPLRRLVTSRKRRDATSIFLKTRHGDKVDITLEQPTAGNDVLAASHDERARSFSPILVNPPPLSTILRPPHSGYADKKRKSKPSKPIKEETSSEEVGEEHEEESTNQAEESANEAVAISPPPEGASVAEAKPIGLAIAGPGGVAASKPQGTAVAGPGGLAIARPVGTAIAGVDVEGSVPIGGQQKNKKKPKQEQEQTDSELHYVGGLTGPIGNPQPKEFADGVNYKNLREPVPASNNIQDNLFFSGRNNPNGFQLKLGQQNGKYGFIPMFSSPVQGTERLQKRMDAPTFFHGLLGNNDQGIDHLQLQNYQMRN